MLILIGFFFMINLLFFIFTKHNVYRWITKKIVSKWSQNEYMIIITYNVSAIPPTDANN